MSKKKGFIPGPGPAYETFFANVCQYVTVMCAGEPPKWTHIPLEERTALFAAYSDWHTAYLPTTVPHLPALTSERNAAWKRSRKALSRFVKVWFRGFPDIVTDGDLKNMGIPPIDPTHTPIGRPPTRPIFIIRIKGTRLLEIVFWDETGESRGIPYGMNGAVISWVILDEPPEDHDRLSHTELATKSPFYLRFREEDRGKTVYIALQWQNETGVRGDYTEIQSAIIP